MLRDARGPQMTRRGCSDERVSGERLSWRPTSVRGGGGGRRRRQAWKRLPGRRPSAGQGGPGGWAGGAGVVSGRGGRWAPSAVSSASPGGRPGSAAGDGIRSPVSAAGAGLRPRRPGGRSGRADHMHDASAPMHELPAPPCVMRVCPPLALLRVGAIAQSGQAGRGLRAGAWSAARRRGGQGGHERAGAACWRPSDAATARAGARRWLGRGGRAKGMSGERERSDAGKGPGGACRRERRGGGARGRGRRGRARPEKARSTAGAARVRAREVPAWKGGTAGAGLGPAGGTAEARSARGEPSSL